MPVQPKSGREALQTFTGGEGDVLISYEYEYTTAVKKGEKNIELVQPDDTFLIQNPIAADQRRRRAAKAFVKFALSDSRPSSTSPTGATARSTRRARRRTRPSSRTRALFKIDDFGGWSKVNDELFDPEKGSVAKIEDDAGVSTAK